MRDNVLAIFFGFLVPRFWRDRCLELDAVELAATLLSVLQSLLNGVVGRFGLVLSIVHECCSGAYGVMGQSF